MSIVLTTGTFNIVHAGHIELLNYCFNFGKVCVGINSDAYVIKKYGKKAISLENRLKVITSLKQISKVYVFDEEEPTELISKLKPDFYIKGPDYLGVKIPEEEILDILKIKFLIPDCNKILSTSNII
jgi:cytidyltransferase-like protein